MGLPSININFQNGQLGQYLDTPDGVFGLLASAAAVSTTFVLNTPYMVRGMSQVAALGITPSVDNYVLYKALKEFYAEAGDGTELWLMGLAKTTKVSDWFTVDVITGKTPAEKLLDAANGKLTMLFTAFSPTGTYAPVITTGIDADVWAALPLAQTLAENYTQNRYAPFYTLFEGYAFDGNKTTVKDLLTLDYDRCQIMLGDTERRTATPPSKGAATGLLAGRKAKTPVNANPARTRDGAVNTLTAFILDIQAELYDVAALHDKGYVSFRNHTGRSGYFFTDDPTVTPVTDDYHYGTHRRTIDKAYRLAYGALIDFLLDDSTVNPNGTIDVMVAKTIETAVISAIGNNMKGELSIDTSDPKDLGVLCVVDLTNNVTSSSRLKLSKLQIKPRGYFRYIDVPLGFVPITN